MNDWKGMSVVLLGAGSAVPDPVRGNPSQAVVIDGEVIVVDCGERATVNLVRAGINPLDVNYLFITHLHWDHMVDYNYLLFSTWNCGKSTPIKVYGPVGTKRMSDGMLEAHHIDVEFVKRYIAQLPDHITNRPLPDPPVQVEEIHEGTIVETDKFKVTSREVVHLQPLGFERSSYAYRIDSEYGSAAFSGDTEPCDAMVELSKDVDVLVHECTFLEDILDYRQNTEGKKGAEKVAWTGHTGPRGAGYIAKRAGAKKLVLTHLGPYDSPPAAIEMASMYYGPRRGPQIWSQILGEAKENFEGPIVIGEDAMVISVNVED